MRATRVWPWALLILYAFSGMTGIAYEVLWARMLTVQFGVSIFGVVVTVAAFMLGLGFGSVLGERLSLRLRNPLRVVAVLEGGVALFALALPQLLRLLDGTAGSLAVQLDLNGWYLLQGAVTLLVLALPALAMGVTFPLMLKVLAPTPLTLAEIYGANTCGGVAGALLPLWLLPAWGWAQAIDVVASIGLLIALGAGLLSTVAPARSSPQGVTTDARPDLLTLLAYSGVGAAALMLEIAWIRLFGMILLRTEYVMALILAIFLLGIGLGSLLARYMRDRFWLSSLPVIAVLFSVTSLWGVPIISAWAEQGRFDSLLQALTLQGLALTALTLPVTLALGAWLPLISARAGRDRTTSMSRTMSMNCAVSPSSGPSGHLLPAGEGESERPSVADSWVVQSGAWLYGVNALGGALGALLAGGVLIPAFGAPGTLLIAASVLLVCGLVWVRGSALKAVVVATGFFTLAVLGWPVRELPEIAKLLPKAQAGSHDVYRHEDALSITQVVERADGQRVLLTDMQRMDAATDQAAVIVQQNQARLPLLLHPAPRSVLFLGLGTGISASGSLPFPDLQRTAVEVSQGVIEAMPWFAPLNQGVAAATRIVRDDARRFLRAGSGHYDVIVGDLFHPDLVGHSTLLSVQQFARAKARLNEGGLFVQWIALNQFDAGSLAVVLRSFARVYPDAVIFMDGFRLALVGATEAIGGAPAMLANLNRMNTETQSRVTGGEGAWTWLGRYWGRINAETGPVQDEWAPRIEYSLPRARYSGEMDLVNIIEELLRQRPTLEQAASEMHIAMSDMAEFERSYAGNELATRGWLATLRGSDEGARLLRLAYEANPRDRWIAFALADAMYASLPQVLAKGRDRRAALQAILKLRPDHVETLRALWRLEREAGNAAEAERYRSQLTAVSPLDRGVRVKTGEE
ncbi:MAG: spermine synthase [Gammaproteobacteria bacterium]|nr:spermine synthase [Gammaproteobacteria bacterium]